MENQPITQAHKQANINKTQMDKAAISTSQDSLHTAQQAQVVALNAVQASDQQLQMNPEQLAEQAYRAAAYGLIAHLLQTAPDADKLAQVAEFAGLESETDELSMAMAMLGLAARNSTEQLVRDEFHELFIGLGRGELVPFASWYLTGFLMETPLGSLRDDLNTLGYQRNEQSHEPEDHVSGVCEVMSMMIQDGASFELQEQFFKAHMKPWLSRFFNDLSQADAAVFYRSVGRFGAAFISFEREYLSMA